MRFKCPNCQAVLNVLDETLDPLTSCPTCGSKDPIAGKTVSYRQQPAGQVAHFALQGEVGRGQFGSVWRARDTKLDRTVAIKIPRRDELDVRTRQMFLREAKAAASLDHHNIVRVYEVFELDSQIYIVSEFIDGDTLKLCLNARRFSYREAAQFMATAAMAVDYANERGIIHRDLKPGNILVDADNQPHITDFGLARQIASELTMTVTGHLVGTPAYMSPEQAAGESHNVDRGSDVFSLGVILYEMLTGQRPFQSLSKALLRQIRTADPRAPRSIEKHLPRDLETICLKALSKEKDRRYSTAGELAEDLQRFLSGTPITSRRMSTFERSARWIRKNVALSAAALVALGSTAAALALAHQGSSEPKSPHNWRVEVTKPINVDFITFPEGAQLAVFPQDPVTGEPRMDQPRYSSEPTPCVMSLLPGDYLVVARIGERFHEVYRHVPKDSEALKEFYRHRMWIREGVDEVLVPPIKIPPIEVNDGMAAFEGSRQFESSQFGNPAIPSHTRTIAPFLLDMHEVTIAAYRAGSGGRFSGKVQRPGSSESDELLLTGTFFDDCVQYAESIGKRLPTEFEYEFAATNAGTTRYPWGNDEREIPTQLAPVGQPDFDRNGSGVVGLFSNGCEFTDSPFAPYPNGAQTVALTVSVPIMNVTIRGGGNVHPPTETAELRQAAARFRESLPRRPQDSKMTAHIGFRCARSKSPRW